ncbi:Short C-terminal domain-containing protein [Bowdeniella nasicola]|uniref:Short C-terminal domain-containing protein n=2 Tax=Bowdeniella nasicola TaxID=208480 RepID=A0A1H3X2C6_9ACTO|nr:Short C-terminal domain-containing protein [Bowdeniella nasicola]
MEFDSHIAGKNAMVRVFPDRVEWKKTGVMSTGAKAALGTVTAGMSLLATGIRGKSDTQVVVIDAITSVTSQKSGMLKYVVGIHTAAGEITMRCSKAEAAQFKDLIVRLKAGERPHIPPAPPQPAPPTDVMDQLRKLGELRDAGVLTEAEFEAKKADLLGRL